MAPHFSFTNALTHFSRTKNPVDFAWKFAVAYLLASLLVLALNSLIYWPVYSVVAEVIAEVFRDPANVDEDRLEDIFAQAMLGMMARIVIGYLVMIVASIALWAMFEAAIQRHYMRGEPFRLRLGNDELRVAGVGFVFMVVLTVAYVVGALLIVILVAILAAVLRDLAIVAGFVGIIAFFIVLFAMMALVVRLSAASALTVRDEKFQFFEALQVTKGRFWPLFGSYLIIWGGLFVATSLIYSASIGSFILQLRDVAGGLDDDPAAVIEFLTRLTTWTPLVGGYLLIICVYGVFLYINAGPAALAARNDPRGGGDDGSLVEVFS